MLTNYYNGAVLLRKGLIGRLKLNCFNTSPGRIGRSLNDNRRWAASNSAVDGCKICGETTTEGSSLCKRCQDLKGANVKELNPFDYFTSIKNKMSFRVNVNEVEAQYRDRMKLIHPDRVQARSSSSDETIEQSMQQAALWASLLDQIKDPIKRAWNILKWKYKYEQWEENAEIEDQGLLMEIIEDTEAVMSTNDITLLQSYQRTWSKRLEDVVTLIAQYFDELENNEMNESSSMLTKLLKECNKYRIIEKLINRIQDQIIHINQTTAAS